MAYSATAKALMLDALCKGTAPALHITHVSAHSAYPATSGNEIATARTPITYASAAAGVSDDSTNGASIAVPAGTVAAIGYWSALTAGTLLADSDVTDEVFAAPGNYVLDDSKLDLNS
jgi:hypothetical protein